MAAFATDTELADFLQGPVASPAATLALDIATSRIQSECGQTLSLVEDDVVTLRGDGGIVTLPESPVIEVTDVVTKWYGDNTAYPVVTNVDYARFGNQLRWVAGYFIRAGASPRWGANGWDWPTYVTVTYTHGYATIPGDIKGCCLMLAAELYTSPDGAGYESIEDYAWRRGEVSKSPATMALASVVRRYGTRSAMVRVG